MAQENAFAPAAPTEEHERFAPVNLKAETAENFLSAQGLDKVFDRDGLGTLRFPGHLPAGKKMFNVMVRKKLMIRMKSEPMTTASVVARPTPTAPSRALSP